MEEEKELEKKNEASQLIQEEKAETGTVIICYHRLHGLIGSDFNMTNWQILAVFPKIRFFVVSCAVEVGLCKL